MQEKSLMNGRKISNMPKFHSRRSYDDVGCVAIVAVTTKGPSPGIWLASGLVLFDPEDGAIMFLLNSSNFLPEYMPSYPRR
jgi:hypothetical protein